MIWLKRLDMIFSNKLSSVIKYYLMAMRWLALRLKRMCKDRNEDHVECLTLWLHLTIEIIISSTLRLHNWTLELCMQLWVMKKYKIRCYNLCYSPTKLGVSAKFFSIWSLCLCVYIEVSASFWICFKLKFLLSLFKQLSL